MAFQNAPAASITLHTDTASTALNISGGDVTVDADRYPYAGASVTVPLTDVALIEQLRVGQRVDIAATEGQTDLDADLGLIRREVSHDGKELTFTLASDEAILDGWADIYEDTTPRDHEQSLRSLVNHVLAKAIPGAHLEPGTVDADVSAAWDGRNLIANPLGSASTEGWTRMGAGVGNISTPVGGRTTNAYRLRITAPTSGNVGVFYGEDEGGGVPIDQGTAYTITCWVRASHTVQVILGAVERYNASAPGGVTSYSAWPVTLSPNTWTPLRFNLGTLSYGVEKIAPRIWTPGALPAGGWLDVDQVMVFDTFEDLDAFNGTTPYDGKYNYVWDGEPFRSISLRGAHIDRPRELFTWREGKTAWSFLAPLIASTGLRLYCDEKRRWHLVDPLDFSVPGRVSVRPSNTVKGADTIDSEDEDASVTGVVIIWRWFDNKGTRREMFERAGEAGKVKTLEFERPFPGEGLAGAHLMKLRGRRRTQDVTVATDYSIRPGQEIQIDLPGTAVQIGTLTRVQWDLTAGLMTLGSGGLRDTPPGAIDLLTGTIDALTGTIDNL
ncbi:hypothetical protein [Microbacterium sp. Mcb102]|uniref:hypothetical protein n=1 Tax=Microbacterium sp. Mcb102 TaxID=2926012 RepID=UPI0021C8F39F|nr:hypothetical protein [Microbacterium sp. Mcb102]